MIEWLLSGRKAVSLVTLVLALVLTLLVAVMAVTQAVVLRRREARI